MTVPCPFFENKIHRRQDSFGTAPPTRLVSLLSGFIKALQIVLVLGYVQRLVENCL